MSNGQDNTPNNTPSNNTNTTPNNTAPPSGQSPNGTTILVLGIIGFFCFVTGIIAWIMGNKEIKLYPNDSNVKAGRICGIISTILAAVGIVIYLIILAVGLAALGEAASRGQFYR